MKKILQLSGIAFTSFFLFSCASTAPISQNTSSVSTQTSPTKSSSSTVDSTAPKASIIAINNKEPEGEVLTLESFEDGNFWYGEGEEQPDFDSAYSASLSEEWCTTGYTSGKWDFYQTSSKKHASFTTDTPIIYNWEDCKYLVTDINNLSQTPLTVKLLIMTEDNGFVETYETQSVNIGKGINTNVIFDLVNGIKVNDQVIHGIEGANNVYKVILEITNDTKGGTLYIDSVRLIK